MAKVELLFFPACPNTAAARNQLARALAEVGHSAEWTEIDVTDPTAPVHVRGYGSPTILVNGKDVTGERPSADGVSCRFYPSSDVPGAPPLGTIIAALRAASSPALPGRSTSLMVVPGALLSVLPVLGCPSCWPAYAGALSAMGVPFLMAAEWLFPLTVGALLLALTGLGYHARRRHGFLPLFLGVVGAGGVLLGKFVFEQDLLSYTGTALLVAASIWNGLSRRQAPACTAGDCIPEVGPASARSP